MALIINRSRCIWSCMVDMSKMGWVTDRPSNRCYAKESGDGCRRALADIPPDRDPKCPHAQERKKKKKQGFLHKIKMRMIDGGTNFGTPFRRVTCPVKVEEEEPIKALPAPEKPVVELPPPRPGVQVSILGADTSIGQYVALLLKQCPCIKKLRLYEAKDTQCSVCNRDLQKVVQDLQHIDTNCRVQAFSCACYELERCLQVQERRKKREHTQKKILKKALNEIREKNKSIRQICNEYAIPKTTILDKNTDIVLMLESGYVNVDMPLEHRFNYQAPIVKKYANAIAHECPKAFIIVCATPIECMVPLVAETLKETNWYDPRKLMGSLAVPEMRASTLAARALCLEPRYTRVPCVGGTEGESLVPLFSKAVEFFDFAKNNAQMMTSALRSASMAVARSDGKCILGGDLSEAHALAGLVSKVAYALICQDLPRVTGFVQTDSSQVISPARYMATPLEISGSGIWKNCGIPHMNDYEASLMDVCLNDLYIKQKMAEDWNYKYCLASSKMDSKKLHFFTFKRYDRIDDCAYATVYLAIDVVLNHKGICKRNDFPFMNPMETELMDTALQHLQRNVGMALKWYTESLTGDCDKYYMGMQNFFHLPKKYDHVEGCMAHMS